MNIAHMEIQQYDNEFAIIKNEKNNKYIKLGQRELRFLFEILKVEQSQVDNELLSCFDSRELAEDEKKILYGKFIEWKFIEPLENLKDENTAYDITKIKILKINPQRILDKIPFWFTYLYSSVGLLGIIFVSLVKYFIIIPNIMGICTVILSVKFSVSNILICFILMEISVVCHEFGHALSCKHYGGKIHSMGVVLFFLFPAMYCDVSEMYMLKGKKPSICISIAGGCANLLFGDIIFGLYYLLYCLFDIQAGVLLLFWIGNFFATLYNFIPFVKLDGYWVVSSLSGVTNLMEKSTCLFIANIFNQGDIPTGISKAKRIFLTCYGGISLIFYPVFWGIAIYNIVRLLNVFSMPFWIVILVCIVIVGIVGKIEFRFCKEQILKYKSEHKRVLKLLDAS